LSIIQGPFSVAPCQTLVSRFATFSSPYGAGGSAAAAGEQSMCSIRVSSAEGVFRSSAMWASSVLSAAAWCGASASSSGGHVSAARRASSAACSGGGEPCRTQTNGRRHEPSEVCADMWSRACACRGRTRGAVSTDSGEVVTECWKG
jgi:hypothetical protein